MNVIFPVDSIAYNKIFFEKLYFDPKQLKRSFSLSVDLVPVRKKKESKEKE